MKITSKEYAIFLDDEKTGKSAVLRLEGAVWILTTGDETHVYDDLDVAITYASEILADARVKKEKTLIQVFEDEDKKKEKASDAD